MEPPSGIRKKIRDRKNDIAGMKDTFPGSAGISSCKDLHLVYRFRDQLFGQYVYLAAMQDYCRHNGKSRGSSLYKDFSGETHIPNPGLISVQG